MLKKILLLMLAMTLSRVSANLTTAAEAAIDANSLMSIVPKENPYHPGETLAIHKGLPTDCWPQLANTPQRTSYTPMKFDPPQGQKKWSVYMRSIDFDNRMNPTVQPIVAEGRVYVGCKSGKFYALDAKTGEVKWMFQAGGAICHTAGYYKGRVMVAALDGCVYAVNAATGQLEWIFSDRNSDRRRHGFSTAVLLAEDRIFAVDRGGRLFALNPGDGKEIWHYDAGAPTDQSPAYDAGKVFFASEDMRVHAVRSADGAGLWKSEQLAGLSFRSFHPVVMGGKVIVRALCSYGGITDNTDPAQRNLFALDEETGKESIVLKQKSMGHDGNQPPPAITRDGLLIVQMNVIPVPKDYGWTDTSLFWALEDLKTQEIVMPLLETEKRPPNKNVGFPVQSGIAGTWCTNENAITSVIGEIVMTVHPLGIYFGPCQMGGAFDLAKRRWHVDVNGHLPDGDGKGPRGWVSYGGDGNECGGADAVSAADGLLYHLSIRTHMLTCYEPMQPSTIEK